MTMVEDDDTVLGLLRRACADHEDRPDRAAPGAGAGPDHDLARLHALRDEALSRGLPLPSSCPVDTPETSRR